MIPWRVLYDRDAAIGEIPANLVEVAECGAPKSRESSASE
jgi:hypothetical protein